jgi:hypothetical protein
MVVSFTASHMDSRERPHLLQLLVDSLRCAGVAEIYISISFCDAIFDEAAQRDTRASLETTLHHGGVHLYWQTGHWFQFDHLRFLYSVHNGDDAILFIDDDDLLLKLPLHYEEYDIVRGHGVADFFMYLAWVRGRHAAIHHDTLTHEDVRVTLSDPDTAWKFVHKDDFSGYIVKHKHLGGFFPKQFERLERTAGAEARLYLHDIDFTTTYLESLLGEVRVSPVYSNTEAFVYHRVWSTEDRPISTWRAKIGKFPVVIPV